MQLRVYKDPESGEPKVECPVCCELVAPEKHALFDSYDCEDCGAVMSLSDMKSYARARSAWLAQKRDEEFDE